jgi:hypothetical protein
MENELVLAFIEISKIENENLKINKINDFRKILESKRVEGKLDKEGLALCFGYI